MKRTGYLVSTFFVALAALNTLGELSAQDMSVENYDPRSTLVVSGDHSVQMYNLIT